MIRKIMLKGSDLIFNFRNLIADSRSLSEKLFSESESAFSSLPSAICCRFRLLRADCRKLILTVRTPSRQLVQILLLCTLFACSTSSPPPKITETYSIAKRKNAPKPLYYPVRSVRSPQPLPNTVKTKLAKKVIIPTFFYDLKNSNLCEIAAALAASLKYSTYCASTLSDRKYSLQRIATPYEVKDLLEQDTGIEIVIDRLNREVRFLSYDPITPEYGK